MGFSNVEKEGKLGLWGKLRGALGGFYWWGKGKNSVVSVGFNAVVFHFQMRRLT